MTVFVIYVQPQRIQGDEQRAALEVSIFVRGPGSPDSRIWGGGAQESNGVQ